MSAPASMMSDLFGFEDCARLSEGAALLHGFAEVAAYDLFACLGQVVRETPLRHMVTPGGRSMSIATTNCGEVGWVTDRSGYRYSATDPETGRRWRPIPAPFLDLASRAASRAGYPGFVPDACGVLRYAAGAKLSLHVDQNEQDFSQPIVSVSLGLPAVFLWGGLRRADRPRRIALSHGDVVVWGGSSRLRFHGVESLEDGIHPLTGRSRYNLTFRRAL